MIVAGAVSAGGYVWNNITAFDAAMNRVAMAGFREHSAVINGSEINYAEGPDNGPALLLIHGQSVDWRNYHAVLPQLAQDYHVFAVDCYGHGKSARVPEKYTALALAADLKVFLAEVVREPALVSGHSSGGLIALAMAAGSPPEVRGVLLEDPPIFSTELPRATQTWNYVDLATTAHTFLESGEQDWVAYSMERSRMWSFFGGAAEPLKEQGRRYHAAHPGEPVRWWILPPSMNEAFSGMAGYDPRFGDAFYTGSWDAGWSHADALGRVRVPVAQVHCPPQAETPDGILMAASSVAEADRAHRLLADSVLYREPTGHGFHSEAPGRYLQILAELRARTGG